MSWDFLHVYQSRKAHYRELCFDGQSLGVFCSEMFTAQPVKNRNNTVGIKKMSNRERINTVVQLSNVFRTKAF